jgi:hypothetical protein
VFGWGLSVPAMAMAMCLGLRMVDSLLQSEDILQGWVPTYVITRSTGLYYYLMLIRNAILFFT